MPVPKTKKKIYGVIVGANINRGKSLSESKKIADKAVKKRSVNDKQLKRNQKQKNQKG